MSTYLLYSRKSEEAEYCNGQNLPSLEFLKHKVLKGRWPIFTKEMLQIAESKKSLMEILIVYNLMYLLFWKWRRKIFELHLLYAENDIVHYTFVLPQCFRLPFMKKRDLEVGPYFTHPDYRGRGLTSYMLGKIIQTHPTSNLYVLVRSENRPSIKVLEKNRLALVGACQRKKLLKLLPQFSLITN